VRTLKVNGFEYVPSENRTIDYGLLKGVIAAMRWFYLRTALILFILFITIGTYYIHSILKDYSGDSKEVYIAWAILCSINTYNLYTLYYDSLLQGKGLIKISKQIVILGQTVYLVIATILIIAGYGLVAIVSAQASSIIIIRWLSYRTFFTRDIKQLLNKAKPRPPREVLKAIYPNALKIGLTSLGGFLVLRSSIIIGSLYLSLGEIASYGITMQFIGILSSLAGIYTATYQPKIAQLRITLNRQEIKKIYLNGLIILLFTYFIGGIVLIVFGGWALNLIGSRTQLIPVNILILATIISLLENNHSMAGGILLSKNEVPFFKAAIFSGALTVFLMLILFNFTNIGLWAMIVAPGLIQGAYQNWKWPSEVYKDLNINYLDFYKAIVSRIKFRTKGFDSISPSQIQNH